MKKIIFLNGVTSTGKTSTAKALQNLADVDIFRLSNDLFQNMTSTKSINERYFISLSKVIELMYRTARMCCDREHPVIIDGMLLDLTEFFELFKLTHYELLRRVLPAEELFMVLLSCSPSECRRRNVARGDRGEDQSDWQAAHMTKNITYDLILDTQVLSPEQCAQKILLSPAFE